MHFSEHFQLQYIFEVDKIPTLPQYIYNCTHFPPDILHIPHHYTGVPHRGLRRCLWSLVIFTVCATPSQHHHLSCQWHRHAYANAIIITTKHSVNNLIWVAITNRELYISHWKLCYFCFDQWQWSPHIISSHSQIWDKLLSITPSQMFMHGAD